MTLRIGVYGGSFDPVHLGHVLPVEETRVRLGLDRIMYVPAYQPPHKPVSTSASAHHRFAMLALALEPYPDLLLSDFEVARGGTTYTIETLRHLRAQREDAEILLVLGSDSLAQIETWRSYREILAEFRLAVVGREGFDRETLGPTLASDIAARFAPGGAALAGAPPEQTIFWSGNAPVTISSTWLRRAIPAGEDLSESLPASVAAYLRKHGLYRLP
ncbi:MAG: nicotinate (nicotinamide) nucleotide adenylyltransferase [Thermoanaerobaculia bacterium]